MPHLLILLLLTLWKRQVKSKCPDSRSPIAQKKKKSGECSPCLVTPRYHAFPVSLSSPPFSGVPGHAARRWHLFFVFACKVLVITLRYDHAEYSAVR